MRIAYSFISLIGNRFNTVLAHQAAKQFMMEGGPGSPSGGRGNNILASSLSEREVDLLEAEADYRAKVRVQKTAFTAVTTHTVLV